MSRRRTILLVAVALIAAILLLPLRLASAWIGLDAIGVSARSASGTVWNGRLEQARSQGFDLGTLDVGLDPLPLLIGRAQIGFDRTPGGGSEPLTGTIEAGIGRRAVSGLNGSVIGGGWGDLPIERIAFENMSALFSDGQCRSAEGRVRITLGVRIAGLELRNGLAGAPRCDGRALLLPLVGDSGMERLMLRIQADGSYDARFSVAATDPALGAALSAAGFAPAPGGFARTMRGQF